MQTNGLGCDCDVHILLDGEEGEEIGCIHVGTDGGVIHGIVKAVTGRHSVFFKVTTNYQGWMAGEISKRPLFELKQFVFMK